MNLRTGDPEGLNDLRRACYELKDILKESLILADLYIIQIAEELKERI